MGKATELEVTSWGDKAGSKKKRDKRQSNKTKVICMRQKSDCAKHSGERVVGKLCKRGSELYEDKWVQRH